MESLIILTLMISAATVLVSSGCYIRPKPPATLRIIFTSDTNGMYTATETIGGPRGGFARRATAIREARDSAPGAVILVDTGNFTSGLSNELANLKTRYVTSGMIALGYDAVNVGLIDAVRPRSELLELQSEGLPLISGGFKYLDTETGNKEFSYPSHRTIDIDGFKVGITGSHLADVNPENLGPGNMPDVTVEDFFKMMDGARLSEEIGMFIVLSDIDTSWQITSEIGSRVPLATVLFGGQAAPPEFNEEKTAADVVSWPIVIPHAGSWGRSVGILDIEFSSQGGIRKYSLEYIDLNNEIDVDAEFMESMDRYLEDLSNLGIDHIPEIDIGSYAGTGKCAECHVSQYEHWSGTPHAKAWENLEESGRIGESTCVPCHTTGYAVLEYINHEFVTEDLRNVGCEACHGPGITHVELHSGELTGDEGFNLIIKTPPESVCRVCHVPPQDEGWLYTSKRDRVYHR